MEAAKQFQYVFPPPLEKVFNILWDDVVQTGGVEQVYADICRSEELFDNLYGNLIGWSDTK